MKKIYDSLDCINSFKKSKILHELVKRITKDLFQNQTQIFFRRKKDREVFEDYLNDFPDDKYSEK